MKAALKAINTKLNNAEERTNDLQDKKIENMQSEQKTQKHMKKKMKALYETHGII